MYKEGLTQVYMFNFFFFDIYNYFKHQGDSCKNFVPDKSALNTFVMELLLYQITPQTN